MATPATQIQQNLPRLNIFATIDISPAYLHVLQEHADLIKQLGGHIPFPHSTDIYFERTEGEPPFNPHDFSEFMKKLQLILPEDAIEEVSVGFNTTAEEGSVLYNKYHDMRVRAGTPRKSQTDAEWEALVQEGLNPDYTVPNSIEKALPNGLEMSYALQEEEAEPGENKQYTLLADCTWKAKNNQGPPAPEQIHYMGRLIEAMRAQMLRATIIDLGKNPRDLN